MKLIGDIIKELRIENELTQEELANKLNNLYNVKLNKGMISKWEANKSEPRFEYVKYLSKLYNVTLDYLLGLSEYRNKEEEFANHKNKVIDITKQHNNSYIKDILENLQKLNDLGKKEAIKRISELTEINKYIYDKSNLEPFAAHHKEGNFTSEDYKNDLDIMNNDDLWNS